MKFMRYICIAVLSLLALACQQVEKTVALPADRVVAPVMNPHADIVVVEEELSNEVTFTWSAADYGYPAPVAYAVYCTYGDAVYQLGEAYATHYTTTKETLNNTLVAQTGLQLPADETSQIGIYVVASISDNKAEYDKRSNVVALNITTMESTAASWMRRRVYVPGAHQGWNPATAPVLWETGENSDVYAGPVLLATATDAEDCEFKFTTAPDWGAGANLGTDLDALVNDGGSGNLKTPAGLYWVEVTLTPDHSTGRATLTPIDCIGVIGTAIGGWGDADDVVMTLAGMPEEGDADYEAKFNAAVNAQIWEGVCENTLADEFKFRLNHAWVYSWGLDASGSLEHLSSNNGANIVSPYSGRVRFAIDFHGDIDALGNDPSNPSPVSAVVEQL
ncbi:SusE domain-containing protein [Alistipes sp.]|uniref:SusE domain-containing protein n=1 Tax=Alistipes sp. TaxID=1872444 RepID=UPI000E8F7A58|nr:SusE domain-containing protein [Alistipes sp.]HBX89989.1 hypothetical protein [Alistipes sp.]HCN14251.1 hypothetical protein [Alistipes sp.]